jgi:signal transduction histidine kinase
MATSGPNLGSGYVGCSFADVLQDFFSWGMLSINPEGTIVALTPQAEELLHLPAALQQPAATALPLPILTIIQEVRKTGRAVADRPVLLHVGNSTAVLSVTVLPEPAGHGSSRITVLLKDVSAADQLEGHLRRLDRLASIGTLAASMAHEIKNALVPVRTFAELLLEQNPNIELGETVRREMLRVDSIVSRMLKFSAPAKPALAPVRLHEILDHSLRLVHHRVESRQIAFERKFHAPSDVCNGDDHQLEQVFVNLLLNAIESMGYEGTLTVTTEAAADADAASLPPVGGSIGFVCVRIKDTGVGIPAENLQSIFEPFFTTKHTGTGLGLSVTRRIIEEHKGSIRVESQPGKGTTFSILLPSGSG